MNLNRIIPVSEPALIGNERTYVLDCLESSWISSTGPYIDRFESDFARFCGAKHCLSCSNGTVAIHIALLGLGVAPGDEIIVPTLTYVATANAVAYCGARPVLVESEKKTWNMDPALIEARITPLTKGIIVVHLYGHPSDMDPIMALARKHGLFVIEDAAEAHGAEYKGRRVGTIGDVSTFSFYGNKIVTTGEGGAVVTNNAALDKFMRQIKGQGQDPERRYWFPMVGYNYRMTNVAAAIGVAQIEKIEWHLEKRRRNAANYRAALSDDERFIFSPEEAWARNSFWMSSVVLTDAVAEERDSIMSRLGEAGIESRPFFYPMHTLPMYSANAAGRSFPVAEYLARQGLNLPSSGLLNPNDIDYITDTLKKVTNIR